MSAEDGSSLLRRDGRTLGAVTTVLTAAGVLGCLVALLVGAPARRLAPGFLLGAVLMLSVPAHVFNVVGTRLLVMSRKQHVLLVIAVVTAALNAALDALFYVLIGPIGIVVATVVLRWLIAAYIVILRRTVPWMIGSDMAVPATPTRRTTTSSRRASPGSSARAVACKMNGIASAIGWSLR